MKKFILILVLLSASTSAVASYYWHQATQLPDWYTSQKESSNKPEVNKQPIVIRTQPISEKINTATAPNLSKIGNHENVKIQLSEADITDVFVSKIAEKTGGNQLPKSFKGIKTTIKDGKIESGAVVNISELPTAQLGENEKVALAKLTENFPFLTNREVYIAVAGKPSVEKGQLKFDDNTEVKIGSLSFTIAALSNKLGIPKEKIQDRINLEMKLGRVKVENVELIDNNALIKGSSN
jgi:hypothetical protein